jgi:hypothetical protein
MSLGAALAFSGRVDEASVQLDKAMRLSPRDPLLWLFMLGYVIAHFAEHLMDGRRNAGLKE